MKRDGNPVARAGVRLDLLLEVAGDEDQLAHVQPVEPVHHPVHHRPPRHLEQRLGHEMGVRPETGALPGERDDHLHVSLFRSGPGAGPGRRAPAWMPRARRCPRPPRSGGRAWRGMCTRLAGLERARLERVAGPGAEDQLAPEHVHRLVLQVVVLQAQHVPRLHVEDLAHVAVGAGPDRARSPRASPPGTARRARTILAYGPVDEHARRKYRLGGGGDEWRRCDDQRATATSHVAAATLIVLERRLEAEHPAERELVVARARDPAPARAGSPTAGRSNRVTNRVSPIRCSARIPMPASPRKRMRAEPVASSSASMPWARSVNAASATRENSRALGRDEQRPLELRG